MKAKIIRAILKWLAELLLEAWRMVLKDLLLLALRKMLDWLQERTGAAKTPKK